MAHGDTNNNDSNKIDETPAKAKDNIKEKGEGDKHASPESVKLITECIVSEKDIQNLVPPVNSVQFMAEWKYLKGKDVARCHYLSVSIIEYKHMLVTFLFGKVFFYLTPLFPSLNLFLPPHLSPSLSLSLSSSLSTLIGCCSFVSLLSGNVHWG